MDSTNTNKITTNILKKYGVSAKKKFGQNFLIDDFTLETICNFKKIDEEDLVIEIGPGLGNLTEYILMKTKNLLLVEIDSTMVEILNNRFKEKLENEILNKDILSIDIDEYIEFLEKKNGKKYKDVKVIANLPYYITTPILFKLLEEAKRVSSIIVMIQKEVAYRILANTKSKEYGVLTVMINAYANTEFVIDVSRTKFIPSPNVDSAVILIQKENKYEIKDRKKFKELINSAFSNRRKKMINSLENAHFLNKNKEELLEILKRNNIDEMARAEEISIKDFVNILNSLE